MGELLKHDLKILASQWKKYLVIVLALPFGFYLLDPGPELYMHPIPSIYVFLIGILMSVTKESTGILMNSLPTEKVDIVKSRFIFMTIGTLAISIYLLLVAYLLRSTGHGIYIQNSNSILAFLNIGFSTLAVLMPIGFISDKALEVVLMIVFFTIMGLGWRIWGMLLDSTRLFTIINLLMFILSYLLSKQFFNEKEFD